MNLLQEVKFRGNAGAVILLPGKQELVLAFERSNTDGFYQLPQGGIEGDEKDDVEKTIWRELLEETGLTPADLVLVDRHPVWLGYSVSAISRDPSNPNFGQAQQYFYFIFKGNVNDIDLTKATAAQPEFKSVRPMTFDELIQCCALIKKNVYRELQRYTRAQNLFNVVQLTAPRQ